MIFFKYFARMLILAFFIVSLIWELSNITLATTSTDITIPSKGPKFTPDPDAEWGFLAWRNSGFSMQPNPQNNIILGDSVNLEVKTVKDASDTFWHPFAKTYYYWYQSDDCIHWSEVSSQYSTTDPSITIKPEKVGKSWYQAHVEYVPRKSHKPFLELNSQLAEIDTVVHPIFANSIKININSSYLFNSGNNLTPTTALAHATIDPQNSTQSPQWESSDHELATIDSNGFITANTQNRSGDVTITGTVKNAEGISISDHKVIHIGGGLVERQTVHAGESAHFDFQDNFQENRDGENNIRIEWHEINKIDGKDRTVTPDTDQLQKITYTKKNASIRENGNKYYAKFFVNGNKKPSFQTNNAELTVLPSPIPNVEVSAKVTNLLFPDPENTETNINNVINGDELLYQLSVNNKSGKTIKNSYLIFPIYNQTIIPKINLNGSPINEADYSFITNADGRQELKIKLNDLKSLEQKNIEFSTMIDSIFKRTEFEATPHYFGEDYQDNIYQNDGIPLHINCINNQLNTKFNDISFEPINPMDSNMSKYRLDDSNNNEIVTIDDERRKKGHTKIYLRQMDQFHNDTNSLDVSLQYRQNGSILNPLTQKILVAETSPNETMHSISWKKYNGLILHINNSHLVPGAYSSRINWYIENSV